MIPRQRVVWTVMTGALIVAIAMMLGMYFGEDEDVPMVPLAAPPAKSAEHPFFLEHTYERNKMVATQLEARDIQAPRVLTAMRHVPRHAFVPAHGQPVAYSDHPIRIGKGQTISQPYIVAYMTQALRLQPIDRVLEVGTGSGYQAAVLAEVVQSVYTIEILPELAKSARSVLNSLGYKNIQYRVGDGYSGWAEGAPFDAIIVTAAPGHVPQPLLDQLAIGGRLIIPVGKNQQALMLIERTSKGFKETRLLPVRFVPMTGKAQQAPVKN